jgi:hypothetical protein
MMWSEVLADYPTIYSHFILGHFLQRLHSRLLLWNVENDNYRQIAGLKLCTHNILHVRDQSLWSMVEPVQCGGSLSTLRL